jgi:hypothetical protein
MVVEPPTVKLYPHSGLLIDELIEDSTVYRGLKLPLRHRLIVGHSPDHIEKARETI